MIETARPGDLAALADLLPAQGAPYPCRHALAEAMHAGARVLLYRTEGVPRGVLIWQPPVPSAGAPDRAPVLALLLHVQVQPIWRRRGLATRLIARAEQDMRAGCLLGWGGEVPEGNRPGERLIRGAGATCEGGVCQKRFQTPAWSSSPATIPR